ARMPHARPAPRSRASGARDKCRSAWNGRRPNPASFAPARTADAERWCGAACRDRPERSSCALPALWLDQKFYSFIEFHIGARVKQRRRSPALAPHCGALAHPVGHQAREFLGNVRHVDVFPALPTRCRIAHAEYGQSRHANVEIGAEFAFGDALLDHVLEDALEPARPAADAAPAFARQMLALIEEYLDEIGSVDQRRQVRLDQ